SLAIGHYLVSNSAVQVSSSPVQLSKPSSSYRIHRRVGSRLSWRTLFSTGSPDNKHLAEIRAHPYICTIRGIYTCQVRADDKQGHQRLRLRKATHHLLLSPDLLQPRDCPPQAFHEAVRFVVRDPGHCNQLRACARFPKFRAASSRGPDRHDLIVAGMDGQHWKAPPLYRRRRFAGYRHRRTETLWTL